MVVNPLDNAMGLLQNFGFFKVVLPMLLIFAIFYAILLKTGILGKAEDDKQPWTKPVAAIVSFAVAFLVVSYTPVVEALNTLIPQAAFLLVIIMLLLMIFAFIGIPTTDYFGTKTQKWAWVLVGIFIFIFICIVDATGKVVIPGIHQLVLIVQGQPIDIPALPPEAASIAIAVLIFLVLPLVVILFVVNAGKTKGTPPAGG